MINFNNKKGFTLIELIVVVAIIAAIAAVVLAGLTSARAKTRNTARLASVDQIAKALQVSTTGANGNQFPTSNGQSRCLGKATCWNSGLTDLASLNAVVSAGMNGGTVQPDSFWNPTQLGDAYVYNSNYVTPTPDAGPLNGIPQQTGAYIIWVMESQSGSSCGRGFLFHANINVTGYECMLYVGPSTP